MSISGTLSAVGEPLGTLTLSGSDQAITFTTATRGLAYVQLAADDAAFLYAFVAGGPYVRIPVGGSERLAVNGSLTIQVLQDSAFAAAVLRGQCVG